MGSLNGTLLNSKAVHHPDSGSRNWGEPKELVSGDVITLGTSSRINVSSRSRLHGSRGSPFENQNQSTFWELDN